MPTSPRLGWPYPNRNVDPWYDAFVDLITAQDTSAFAAMEDRNIFLMGGGTMGFTASSGLLSWGTAIEISSPISGFRHTLAAGSQVLADGEMLYVELSRNLTNNATVAKQVSSSLPPSVDIESFYAICLRRGSILYFRNGDVLVDGDSKTLLSSDSGSGGGAGFLRMDFPMAFKNTSSSGTAAAIGSFEFNPSLYVTTPGDWFIYFVGFAFVAGSGDAGTLELYNITAETTVSTLTFNDEMTSTTKQFELITPESADDLYEIRFRRSAGSGSITSMWAGLRVSSTEEPEGGGGPHV